MQESIDRHRLLYGQSKSGQGGVHRTSASTNSGACAFAGFLPVRRTWRLWTIINEPRTLNCNPGSRRGTDSSKMKKIVTLTPRTESDLLPIPHPGETLLEDFMKPLDLSAYAVAKAIGATPITISMVCRGKRSISVLLALRLARYFGTSTRFGRRIGLPPQTGRLEGSGDGHRFHQGQVSGGDVHRQAQLGPWRSAGVTSRQRIKAHCASQSAARLSRGRSDPPARQLCGNGPRCDRGHQFAVGSSSQT